MGIGTAVGRMGGVVVYQWTGKEAERGGRGRSDGEGCPIE
jgi:hypothetical protein